MRLGIAASTATPVQISDDTYVEPHRHRRTAVRALDHLGQAGAADTLMPTRGGEVRLVASEADDARALAANR